MEKHKFMNNLKLPNQLVCMYLDWSKWGNLEKPHTEAVKTFNIQKLVLVKQQDCGCGAFPMQLTTRCHCWNVLVSAKPTTLHNVLLCQIVVECGRSLDLSHVMHESLLCWLSDYEVTDPASACVHANLPELPLFFPPEHSVEIQW